MNEDKKLSMQKGMISVNSHEGIKLNYATESDKLNDNNWVNNFTKGTYNHNTRKYTLMTVLFIFGLVFVSTIKNETRSIQKEINGLQSNINSIKFNLDQAILDNEVITSPENISFLAKEYLNTELDFYKRSQIKKLNNKDQGLIKISKVVKENNDNENKKKIPNIVKSKISKEIKNKKKSIKKLQTLYSQPETIPEEAKNQITKKISSVKEDLKSLYNSPKETITLNKVGRWSAIQVVKVFLGMPVIPGR